MGVLRGELVELRPLESRDAPGLRAMRSEPPVSQWWGPLEEQFPLGDEPTAVRFAITDRGELAGMVQFTEEPEPSYRHAEIDIFLGPAHHGRGLGTDAVRTLARHLIEARGHHRLVIGAATDNHAAVRCYTRAGFRPVGITRASWRDPEGRWRDEVLMELVVMPQGVESPGAAGG